MKNKEYWILWAKAAGVRAVKTVAETALALIGADMVNIVSLDWMNIAGVCYRGDCVRFSESERLAGSKGTRIYRVDLRTCNSVLFCCDVATERRNYGT